MRVELFRELLEAIPIWPQKKNVRDLSDELEMAPKAVQDRISRMGSKYLFSSETIMKTEYYFFSTLRDKTRTLENLKEDEK